MIKSISISNIMSCCFLLEIITSMANDELTFWSNSYFKIQKNLTFYYLLIEASLVNGRFFSWTWKYHFLRTSICSYIKFYDNFATSLCCTYSRICKDIRAYSCGQKIPKYPVEIHRIYEELSVGWSFTIRLLNSCKSFGFVKPMTA